MAFTRTWREASPTEWGAVWDAINRYVVACGGNPSAHVYGNTPRQTAVAEIERHIDAIVDAAAGRECK